MTREAHGKGGQWSNRVLLTLSFLLLLLLQGYRQSNAFMVTQAPLDNTVNDLWRMVWESGSKAIVMLNDLQDDMVQLACGRLHHNIYLCASPHPPTIVTFSCKYSPVLVPHIREHCKMQATETLGRILISYARCFFFVGSILARATEETGVRQSHSQQQDRGWGRRYSLHQSIRNLPQRFSSICE